LTTTIFAESNRFLELAQNFGTPLYYSPGAWRILSSYEDRICE
jgi:hypothetical protein